MPTIGIWTLNSTGRAPPTGFASSSGLPAGHQARAIAGPCFRARHHSGFRKRGFERSHDGPKWDRRTLVSAWARAVLLRQGNLSGRITDCLLRSRPAAPSLNGLRGSRAVLLADRLDRSPLQVMAHRILPRTGHEVARAARVSPKRPR